MLELETPSDLLQHIGRELGPSEWVTVTQAMIDGFAEATGDHQWIHVDVERARREMPGGKTIAHGYLTLSLIPRLRPGLMRIRGQRRSINYGCNRVRFLAPVPAGSRVRLRWKLLEAQQAPDGGVRLNSEMTVELEGSERPAMVAETVGIVYG
jgi:acyl dehydratase